MKTKHYAVITADLVNSTQFEVETTQNWLNGLIDLLLSDQSFTWTLVPEIFRGDSFQAVLENYEEAMRVALLCRAYIRSQKIDDTEIDIRIAIGIGGIKKLTDRPGTSDGEAFRLSGHLADQIKNQNARIGIHFNSERIEMEIINALLETLIENWTTAQSEIICKLMLRKTFTEIAEELDISQSAVSQRAKSAKWWVVEQLLKTLPILLSKK